MFEKKVIYFTCFMQSTKYPLGPYSIVFIIMPFMLLISVGLRYTSLCQFTRVPTASYKSYNLDLCPIFVLYFCQCGFCPIFS